MLGGRRRGIEDVEFGVAEELESGGEVGELVDEVVHGGGGGAEFVDEFESDHGEVWVDDECFGGWGRGGEAVGLGVLGDFLFAFKGTGAGGFSGVFAVGEESGFGEGFGLDGRDGGHEIPLWLWSDA